MFKYKYLPFIILLKAQKKNHTYNIDRNFICIST